jgi:hypothetical protein
MFFIFSFYILIFKFEEFKNKIYYQDYNIIDNLICKYKMIYDTDLLSDFNLSIDYSNYNPDALKYHIIGYMWFFGYLIEKVIATHEEETEKHEIATNPIMTSNYYLKNFKWERNYTEDESDNEEENDTDNQENKEDKEEEKHEESIEVKATDKDSSVDEKLSELTNHKHMTTVLRKLINIDSLDRNIILYYIFLKQSVYRDAQTNKLLNTYEEFKIMCNNYGGISQFNLYDVDNPCDIIIYDDKYTYETSTAELNFISWVGESGIYDYVINNELFRYNILTEMNKKNLLKGNHFLQYQLIDDEQLEILYDSSIVSSSDTESINSQNYSHDDENNYTAPLDKLDNDYVMRQLTVEGYMLMSRIKNAVKPIFIDIYNQILEW